MKPAVLVFAASDGGGGAGLLADCRALAFAGCRPLAVVTGVSAQNSEGLRGLWPVPAASLRAQFAALAEEEKKNGGTVAAVKIGVLAGNAEAVAECLRELPGDVLVVWDPVVAPGAGGRKSFADADAIREMRRIIAPHVFLATPNPGEIKKLTGTKFISKGARALMADGARNVVVTGVSVGKTLMRNELYCEGIDDTHDAGRFHIRPGNYHGSGCMFSSLAAGYLARREELIFYHCGGEYDDMLMLQEICECAHRQTLSAVALAAKESPGEGRYKTLPLFPPCRPADERDFGKWLQKKDGYYDD